MSNDWYTTDLKQRPVQKLGRARYVQQLVIVLMLLCVMGAIFVPLWQRGVNRSLEVDYKTLLENRQSLEEQQQVLKASISSLSMPEALIHGAWREDIAFQPIKAQAVVLVARSNP